jgi:3-mercaptopyruvate sulfurtransferase SseA
MLMDRGYRPVRPLAGGLEAWIEAGYAVEPDPIVTTSAAGREGR